MTMLRNADGNAGVPGALGGVARGAPGDESCVNDAAGRVPSRARRLTVPVLLLAMLAAVAGFAFAPGAKAQGSMIDINDADWDFNGWVSTTASTLASSPVFTPTGGTGTYILPNGWTIVCATVFSATSADFDFYFTATGFVTTINMDNSGGAVSVDVVDSASGSTCHLAIGTAVANSIIIPDGMSESLVFGLAGNDGLGSNSSSDVTPSVIFGGDGNDNVKGSTASCFLYGDWLIGGAAATGNDTMSALGADDWLVGGPGNDDMTADAGDDVVIGDAGMDDMFGAAGVDWMFGGGNDDLMRGGAGADWLVGGTGNDALDGGADADLLEGDDGAGGGSGNDFLHDNDGSSGDVLDGEGGKDQLFSLDTAVDTLIGGSGTDYSMHNALTDSLPAADIENPLFAAGPLDGAMPPAASANYTGGDPFAAYLADEVTGDFWGATSFSGGARS